jgi:hypothetical protein
MVTINLEIGFSTSLDDNSFVNSKDFRTTLVDHIMHGLEESDITIDNLFTEISHKRGRLRGRKGNLYTTITMAPTVIQA